jgi:hypothetical protein
MWEASVYFPVMVGSHLVIALFHVFGPVRRFHPLFACRPRSVGWQDSLVVTPTLAVTMYAAVVVGESVSC